MFSPLDKERNSLRNVAKYNILKIQTENQRYYNKRHKKFRVYKEVFSNHPPNSVRSGRLSERPYFLGPYPVSRVRDNDKYDVVKV